MSTLLMTEPVQLGSLALPGDLVIPPQAMGLVMFVHGSGSGRQSPRNRWVAAALQQHHLATLLFDLLTEEEAQDPSQVFNIALLGQRVLEAIHWTGHHPDLAHLRLGLFGASTGAAAALAAAAVRPDRVTAVVSRGGRPDLAMDCLPGVQAATLLIVGGLDTEVLALNRQALRQLNTPKRLEVVPGASHLFEEPGALGSVAVFAASWFEQYLGNGRNA
ncbi:dienelactone hydrolase family protein [Hydrogenophaga sp.]|jgi:pimeloyl-ACP methyl ester carboxylesterase|uniref:dienelactone hydrolase family protein n=1 Tax=Hydrogenophaga sp. TaxID=1904254 RepID=UPI0025C23745|nr:dienelactone hydrolase family protein [Hydrogenophaga sp.]MDO8888464.1 dienelactone hydrolase family protein [Hydrogenophaga sp.]MDO9507104.1 dienelactone hydrolase family protein [Hydrogenophaga sp.]MDP1780730.1 dienelactone hydrolase family protein [Hydrogenophaga sp.]MDP2248810.1 dienelactone hydrolase family protein [Hydrogenophaga sp.]MDP2988339.1 dienelactone hydrolase family protein [Hydrogenophaga sp.]